MTEAEAFIDEGDVPAELRDPITWRLLRRPTTTATGSKVVFEAASMVQWIKRFGTHPADGHVCTDALLVPDLPTIRRTAGFRHCVGHLLAERGRTQEAHAWHLKAYLLKAFAKGSGLQLKPPKLTPLQQMIGDVIDVLNMRQDCGKLTTHAVGREVAKVRARVHALNLSKKTQKQFELDLQTTLEAQYGYSDHANLSGKPLPFDA